MNKPYVCHNCSTTFDAFPDALKEELEAVDTPMPDKLLVHCPGCYLNGFTSAAEMNYTLNLSTMQKV